MISKMALEFISQLNKVDTKATGKTTKRMAKVYSLGRMEVDMKEITKIISNMVLEFILMMMEVYMKGNGTVIKSMVMAN